ncbi:DUF2515 family protein [Jeotgalibacillus sp. S-D1]|uniref:DUF2515 family protein n=1 Tax=Jeotgalibacillus sp. S-D1 TaxID=2552189 RepID=UPI0014055CDB|nr:DUF2515 family protein [Jeotgalibacillus sp. S-D1]
MFPKWLSSFIRPQADEEEVMILSKIELFRLQKKWMHDRPKADLSNAEEAVVSSIKENTDYYKKNNVTRTKAYLELYQRNPELHWAFLAHMVSRNAGWNMTDLKGHSINQLLSYNQKALFFRFLEKANYLIFEDAFPQLLLYEKSKSDRINYAHLLPHFGVSLFMLPIWQQFIDDHNKNVEMLTVSLIINEQHFLETHVMQNAFFKKNVLQSFTFQLQERLGFTHILFPHFAADGIELAGLTVQQFSSLPSRIEIGKNLYVQLFKGVLNGAQTFAYEKNHTGSRSDYFPDLFSCKKELTKIWSPLLTSVWEDVQHPELNRADWFKNSADIEKYYSLPGNVKAGNMTAKHLLNIVKLSGLNELQQLMPYSN